MKTAFRTFTILCSVWFASCQQSEHQQLSKPSSAEKEDSLWRHDFKGIVMCRCVINSIGDKKASRQLEAEDQTLYHPINFILEDSIDHLLVPIIRQIKQDSINSLTTVGEGAQGKHVFSSCLRFYESKALDSATQNALKRWKMINIDSAIAVNAPAY